MYNVYGEEPILCYSLHLRNKNYIEKTKILIFNLKILLFLEFENMLKFYQDIKKQNIFNDELYDIFSIIWK